MRRRFKRRRRLGRGKRLRRIFVGRGGYRR